MLRLLVDLYRLEGCRGFEQLASDFERHYQSL
jgi:hypothetical protein